MKKLLFLLFPLLLACSSEDDATVEEGRIAGVETTSRTPDGNYPIAIESVSEEEFANLFEHQYWSTRGEIYHVYSDGRTELMSEILGGPGWRFGIMDEANIWEYYNTAYETPYQQIRKGTYSYDADSHTLYLQGEIHKLGFDEFSDEAQKLILVSIDKEKMSLLGPVFDKQGHPDAVYSLYVFEHLYERDDFDVRGWLKELFGEENFPF